MLPQIVSLGSAHWVNFWDPK